MENIRIRDIVEAVNGRLLCGDMETSLRHISIDSRTMKGDDLFVPLIGEKADAHRFLSQAFENGAAALNISCVKCGGRTLSRPLRASMCGKYDMPTMRLYERIALDLISACGNT